jgi:hypothetical protein
MQAMQTARIKIRGETEAAELERVCERLEHIEPALDPFNNDSFEAESTNPEGQTGIMN